MLNKNRRAFTLLELIIVIFLLSLLSFFVVGNIKRADERREVVGIANIKNILKGASGYYELVCLNRCRECFLVDSELNLKKINTNFRDLKAYILDNTGQFSSLEFGRVDDQKVCFRFIFYPNGSTSQMVVENQGEFYYIPSYFGEIQKFGSLNEAKEFWEQNRYLLRGGDYY